MMRMKVNYFWWTCLWVASIAAHDFFTSGSEEKCIRGPIHSWETVPVSFHASRIDTRGPTGLEFLPEDLEALRRYPLITLEKWQGGNAFSTDLCQQQHNNRTHRHTRSSRGDSSCDASSDANIFYWEDEAWISAAKQIKAVHPTASIAVWMVRFLVYPLGFVILGHLENLTFFSYLGYHVDLHGLVVATTRKVHR
jgi:hypothetical protein